MEKKKVTVYEVAQVIFSNETEAIANVGSKYPVLARTVAMINDKYLLDLLAAMNVPAEEVEKKLRETFDGVEEEQEEKKEHVKKTEKKVSAKKESKKEAEEQEDEEETDDYESMTVKDLYDLCCKRGVSSKCKNRQKKTLIEVLRANEAGTQEPEIEEDEWEEEAEDKNPYDGKTAKELYKMCCDRGIKTKPKQTAAVYAELLMKDDAKKEEPEVEEDEDDDDDWEF